MSNGYKLVLRNGKGQTLDTVLLIGYGRDKAEDCAEFLRDKEDDKESSATVDLIELTDA